MLSLIITVLLMLPSAQVSSKESIRILFLGNSHTTMNRIPATVKSLIESDDSNREVTVAIVSGATLKAIYNQQRAQKKIRDGNWDYVVLQGQEISMSHKYDYSKAEAIALARLAKASGAKPLLFAEWPRRGIDESNYIYNIYKHIAEQSGAEVVPICYAFDLLSFDDRVHGDPPITLWASDGNHSSPNGAMLASLTIYYWISGTNPNIGVAPINPAERIRWLLHIKAAAAVHSYKKK